MLPEIWEPSLTVVFVGTAVDEISDRLGFHYLHPRDRFWELLEIGGLTLKRMITPQERKALADGQKDGSVSDPVRLMFTQKKTSQLLKLGIGFAYLNRRVIAGGAKDKSARPTEEDVQQLIVKALEMSPKILAFVTRVDVFQDSFTSRYPTVSDTLGPQPFKIGSSEAWLLGSTSGLIRGEALTKQEDAFFALGERISVLTGETPRE